MAIRTFSAQQRYSRNRGEETEPKKKLKKLKSVKVANLDRLRLSMRREKSRFGRSFMAFSDDAYDPSGSSSTPMSEKSSPNYMKATSSSSARKGSSRAISGTVLSSPASSSSDARVSARNFQVENIRPKKSLKRVSSVKHVKKLSSMKSMKIRAKYSQFQEDCNDAGFTMVEVNLDYEPDSLEANYVNDDQGNMVRDGNNRKSILKRSRSIKLTKLRSIRYSRRLPKSRLGGVEEQMSYEEISNATPHYMKGTSSHEARKNSAKGLTRTSSWRPLRILAKIPSLRPRRSKVRKRPQVTPLSRTGVNRATCSSTLKRTEFPDHIELLSGERESEGASSVHICPYTYCSLNGHHHHAPSLPIKEFISAKRKSLKNQKGQQLRDDVKHVISTSETDQSRQMVFTEIDAFQMVNPTPEEEDAGQDFLITVYDKPRKKWTVEGNPSGGSEALIGLTYVNKISETDYDWELPEAPSKISEPKGRQEALNEGLEEPQAIFRMCNVEANNKNHQEISTTTSNGANESSISEEKIQSFGGDLINILSDNQKYTNIWHLIYQQFVSSDGPKTGTEGISGANEKEGGDVNTCHKGNELYQEQNKYSKIFNEDEDNQKEATENPDFDQKAALKLVQEGLNAILERDAESVDKQSKPDSLAREYNSIPDASTRDNIKLGERIAKAENPGQPMSDSYRKLRKIFVTAKIIKAMERMKTISPREPRYLTVEPTLEREKVYLKHLSMKERKNTEEWKLDYALRWAISKLGPDQQRRVAQLVEAFETVTPGQREGIRHYPMKSEPITTSDLAIPVDEEHGQTMTILDEQVNPQQDDFQSHKSGPEKKWEAHEDHTRATDSPLQSSGNSCIPVYTRVYDEDMVKEPMSIPEDPPQFPTWNSDVNTGEMTKMFLDKQKYTCMWNLIYQQVASGETSMDREEGENVFDEEEQQGEAIKCKDTNGRESTMSSYSTNPKEDEDNQNEAREMEMKESDQSAAVKLVKEALDAILKRYEQSSENQRVKSYTDESLREDGWHVEKHANPEGEEKFSLRENTAEHQQQVGPNESQNPPREKSKSYNRLKKAFVTAKFINAMQRLRMNIPRKSQSLPPEAGFKEEKVYLRHLSIDGRRCDEECMLDYALRKVISKMAPDQQRRVEQLVEAFETVTPQQKEKSLVYYPSGIETATAARSATHTSVSLNNLTEKMHRRSISDEQDYQVPQNQDNGVLLSSKGASHERSLEGDHDCKASTAGHITLQKTVEEASSETITESYQNSSISTPADIPTKVLSIGVEETTIDADIVSCLPTEGSEVRSEGVIASILSNKHKYTSMWQLIHQQVVSSEASKVEKQEFNEDDKKECREINYPDSTQISSMEKVQKDKDSQSVVLNQSAAIKLVKEAIDAILQSHEQRFDQKTLQYDDKAMNRTENHRNPRSEDNMNEKDNTRVQLQEKSEEKTPQSKMPNSHSKLKRIFVTAKFIAAMERLRKINWSEPRHLPPVATSVNEKVYLRHLSIDGRKNREEWMLDYALRHVISSLAPDQQRKVASLVGAFETVNPERKGNGFKDRTKDECSPAIKTERIEDEKEIVDSEDNSMFYDDHFPQTQGARLSLNQCAPSEKNQQEDCQTDTSSIKTESSEALDSDKINLDIQHQAIPKGCLVPDTLTVRKDADASIVRTPQHASLSENHQRDFKHDTGKGLFSDKQKTNSMWHLICQHLQSVEGGGNSNEGLGENDHMRINDTSFEMTGDDNYDGNDTDESSVTSELTENDAIKLVKESIDDILEGPRELDNELISSLSTSSLEKDQMAGQRPEKSLSRGYSKLRHLIICNKFIKTMQKVHKIQPQKQNIPALYSGAVAGKANRKSNETGEKKDTDEWMLDNVLQKVISGLAPAKQRRVALLVEAFEKVNPEQEERGTKLIYMKKESADAISLEGNGKENGITVVESSQHSSESPDSLDLKLDGLVTTSNMKLAIDKVPQDISEGKTQSLKKEHSLNKDKMKGDTPFTSSDLRKDSIEVSSGDDQGVPSNEMESIEKHLVGHCDQTTKVDKEASLPEALKDEGIYRAQRSTSLDKGNNISLWGLILQHVKTDIPEKVEMKLSDDIDTKGNSENSSQFFPEDIYDKEVDIPTATRHELYESEAVKLIQEAVNELLTLPEQEDDYQSISTRTISEQARAKTLMGVIGTPEDEKAPANESLPSTYSKLSRVIMCKRFIKAMSKMRQLKPQPLQEHSVTAQTETKGTPSLRQTESGEKKSWEEGMLDYALQQVVGKLAPAQKKRVSLLVQAFETVGSQPEPTTGQRAKAAFW